MIQATSDIYTLSLHDALPIFTRRSVALDPARHSWNHCSLEPRFSQRHLCSTAISACGGRGRRRFGDGQRDRKSTRLNSSHLGISYAVFCLKKKKRKQFSRDRY